MSFVFRSYHHSLVTKGRRWRPQRKENLLDRLAVERPVSPSRALRVRRAEFLFGRAIARAACAWSTRPPASNRFRQGPAVALLRSFRASRLVLGYRIGSRKWVIDGEG